MEGLVYVTYAAGYLTLYTQSYNKIYLCGKDLWVTS